MAIISKTKVGVHLHFLTVPDEDLVFVFVVVLVYLASGIDQETGCRINILNLNGIININSI